MNWFQGKKIVVPIDFSEQSHEAVDRALELASGPTDVYVVHVMSDLAAMAPEVVWQEITDESRRVSVKEAFKNEYSDAKYSQVNFHAKFGDAGHGIAEYAEELDAELIVMPSHGRSGISRLLIGSVAERVLRYAHCPVLVLRK